MLSEIDHIEIEASDADEMAAFLEKLGYEHLRKTDHHGTSYELGPADGDGPIFEIHTVEGEETPGINHIAFSVDEIEDVTEELKDADVDQVSDPYYVDKTGRTITNFRDPDGRRFQVVSDDE
ncbi:glyoxylase I family protein [Natrinema sp. CBA1119]|uniref:VOC family protein n=1 Tax=Natrinema sp. CBA1119 TaxID=1608465 RepID=UPI000BF830DA|nr:VOC family protein [Natrinema sp. CBA1119]PGF13930.1 glyoxylase I family protein [Natrinema sp. CBA1119]